MIPLPFIRQIPKIFQSDYFAQKIANKADIHLNDWKKDVLDLNKIYRSDEMNSILLDELGYFLNANLLNVDSELDKRKKIQKTIYVHKNRCLWKNDVKIRIDRIAGYDSQIYSVVYGGSRGNIAINCHYGITMPVLTTEQINMIIEELKNDVVPAYMKVWIGYVDGSSTYIEYSEVI